MRIKERIKNILINIIYHNDKVKLAKKMGVSVGDNCRFIGNCSFGSEPWLISIGNHVNLSGVTFITHDGATWCFRDHSKYKDVIRYGRIRVGNNCFLGQNAIILPGVTLGDNLIVGAGSVVTNSFEGNVVIAGVPAKVVSSMESYAEKCLAETPKYDLDLYKRDKKSCLIDIL